MCRACHEPVLEITDLDIEKWRKPQQGNPPFLIMVQSFILRSLLHGSRG